VASPVGVAESLGGAILGWAVIDPPKHIRC
jgi:hypothetical protein